MRDLPAVGRDIVNPAPIKNNPDPLRDITPLSDMDALLAPLQQEYAKQAEIQFTKPLGYSQKVNPRAFTPLHVRAFVKGNMTWRKNGMAEITLQFPYEYREHLMRLVEMIEYPMELYMRPCISKFDQ